MCVSNSVSFKNVLLVDRQRTSRILAVTLEIDFCTSVLPLPLLCAASNSATRFFNTRNLCDKKICAHNSQVPSTTVLDIAVGNFHREKKAWPAWMKRDTANVYECEFEINTMINKLVVTLPSLSFMSISEDTACECGDDRSYHFNTNTGVNATVRTYRAREQGPLRPGRAASRKALQCT